jgi:hypothetical protein
MPFSEKTKKSTAFKALEKAGYTVKRAVKNPFEKTFKWFVVEKPRIVNGVEETEKAVILRQSANKWHYFFCAFEGTASGSSPENCDKGGLGDVISTESEMRTYQRMILDCPQSLFKDCQGIYRESSNVFNSDSAMARKARGY